MITGLPLLILFPIGAPALSVDGLMLASHDHLENIIVTASGRAQGSLEAPVTVDTVGGDIAQRDNASWVGEKMNRMPGVFFSQLRGPADAPAIRQPISFDNVYLFLQDGVPLQSPVSFNHGAFAYSGALTSFGGIEVLKGPGSALHGSDAMVAVVNVKSRQPEFEDSGVLGLRGGEYGLFDARIELNSAINERHALLWAFSDQQDDNWRDNTAWERQQHIIRHRFRGDGETEANTILLYTDFDARMSAAQLTTDPTQDGLVVDVDRDEAKSPTQLSEKIFISILIPAKYSASRAAPKS
jgi:outer membrane receptor protein involved in Fe transport